ncbi:hypothetical protein TrLO_g4554 [Triparma laevis f. longispina]|uniref:SRCR domain-containing protein n=1 Tax=Triparma laevis f. longispina TaxID=1714387 RepID=A0A9W6ZA98_9STRA|nr:hypothetical protein TrLO_g4554 [Triparma laevis f. longispina]
MSCEPGTYTNLAEAATSCMNCDAGCYSSTPNATSAVTCLVCEAGKASSTFGATSESTCTTCSSGVSSDDRSHSVCRLGSGAILPTSQLQDGTSVRIRVSVNGRDLNCNDGTCEDDGTDISPTFDSEGVVEGRVEVKPSGETAWGAIHYWWWGDADALVACRQLGNKLGYATFSGTHLIYSNTLERSGEIWWRYVECSGSEESLESCSKSTTTSTSHYRDIGITCKFATPSATSSTTCLACGPGSYPANPLPSCTKCEAGHYSSTPSAASSSTCLECGAGKSTSNSTGSCSCTDCEPGTYSTYEASASCTACVRSRKRRGFFMFDIRDIL